jgi:hypothetical protein
MMKAGLITFHYAHHYGAQLQAYALKRSVEKLGMQCEIIDYVRPDNLSGSSLFKSGISPRTLLSNIHTLVHYKRFKTRSDRFLSFYRSRLKPGTRRYNSYTELLADPPVYDFLICGSDQVWNPLIFSEKTFDPSFFLGFSQGSKRIAYAPSFGISSIPEDKKDLLRSYLEKFDAISVREAQGASIIRELAGRDVPVVLDPTLLINESDWSLLCSASVTDKPYILSYFISDPTPFFPVLRRIQEKLRLPVICLCGSRKKIPGTVKTIYDAGPEEFLGLFRNAGFVLTNSFHGTVFSIQFKKPFYSFRIRKDSSAEVNSRLVNLLNILGLEDRLSGTDAAIDSIEEIDYGPVIKKLENKREESLDYLRQAFYGNNH